MKKENRRLFMFLNILVVALIIAAFTTVAANAAEEPTIVDSGTYRGLTWTLDETGLLTIDGDYDSNAAQETDKNYALHKNDVVSAKVTNATKAPSFNNFSALREVSLPEGLQEIPGSTFFWCFKLNRVNIPDGVTKIGEHAFDCCCSLFELTMPVTVTQIGFRAFYEAQLHVLAYQGTPEQWSEVSKGEDCGVSNGYNNYLNEHEVRMRLEDSTPATCNHTGYNEYSVTCSKCSWYWTYEVTTPIDPANHVHTTNVPAAEATEAAHGYTAGVWCPDCETWLSGHDIVHNALGAQTVIQAPTEEEEGLVEIVCTVCNGTFQYTADKLPPSGTGQDHPIGTGDTGSGFWARIRTNIRGFIDWFLRLFRFFG